MAEIKIVQVDRFERDKANENHQRYLIEMGMIRHDNGKFFVKRWHLPCADHPRSRSGSLRDGPGEAIPNRGLMVLVNFPLGDWIDGLPWGIA